MKNILVVSATKLPYSEGSKNTEFYSNTKLGPSLALHEKIGNVDKIIIEGNNTDGLCKVYNRYFKEEYKDYIVVFVHDDVEINTIDLKRKLNAAMEKYDVVGVAGSANHSLKSLVLWHNSPREAWSGAVEHPISENSNTIQTNFFGPYPRDVITLDGLLLAVNMGKALEVELRFDEQFDFHFYDLDFSVAAFQKGLKVGTWNINTTHYSHGDFRNAVWAANEQKYIEKWKQ
jgi:GT2 family glycosyltransferase